jgi:hypothetical protein
MTQEQMIELARRAVACPKWRWMPGMRWWTEDDRGRLDDFQPEYMGRPPDALPDLTDPATLGCLLSLVREAWGDPYASSRWLQPAWKFLVQRPGYVSYTVVGEGYTEAEALTRALESAP